MAQKPKPVASADVDDSNDDNVRSSAKLPFYQAWIDGISSALSNVSVSQSSLADDNKSTALLKECTLEGVAQYMLEKKPKNVLLMTGAGISTSAGIPDFRTPGSGLYDNLAKYNLPDPHAIFDIAFFMQNPEPFFALARELFPKVLKPTPCHYFMRLLEEKGYLRRVFTQNIDGLEYIAGIPESRIITAHGSHHTSTCLKCRKVYNFEWITRKMTDTIEIVPKCDVCDGVVKPDIVFFGEALPPTFFRNALVDFPKCDLLIIMGTSLVVQPFASMISQVDTTTPRLLINMTKVGQSALRYDDANNTRDVFWQGTCDDGCEKLANLLGFGDELQKLMHREWARIDANTRVNDGDKADVSVDKKPKM